MILLAYLPRNGPGSHVSGKVIQVRIGYKDDRYVRDIVQGVGHDLVASNVGIRGKKNDGQRKRIRSGSPPSQIIIKDRQNRSNPV